MTILEKKSKRKALAIRRLVESGEYSPQYALDKAEELNDANLLLDADYEPLAEWLEELLQVPEVIEPEDGQRVPEEEPEGDVEDDNT